MAEATVSDKFAQVRGFSIEITGAQGKEVDTAWEQLSSGSAATTIGSDKFQTTSPGHKSVNSVTLRGAMTAGRKALCTWINETAGGQDWRRDVRFSAVLEDGTRKQFVYHDCFPVRYVFPRMQVLDPDDPGCDVELVEEVAFTYRSVTELPGT